MNAASPARSGYCRVLVVIPAYNEESRIGQVVASVRQILPDAEVLVVDDASTDGTKEEAKGAGATVLSHTVNMGYASSLELGFIYALNRGYDIIVQMDGDGQHLAREIPLILNPVIGGEADILIGSRHLLPESPAGTTWARRIGQHFFASIFNLITGEHITDPTSGFQCLNRKAFRLFANGHFPDDFPDADVLLISHYAGLVLKEVPVVMKERAGGKSMHSGWKPLYYMVKMLLSIFIVILDRKRWRVYES
jgi:glycosyltransferase involved in cell wall biosynthesis